VSTPVSISVQHVRKEFGDKVALNDVSLELAPGTFTVLLGPSGSGKTTLLRCLAGIEQPTSGVIRLGDHEVFSPRGYVSPDKRNLSMVFQDYALWPHLRVRQNIAYPLMSSTYSKQQRATRVDDLLERVGISHLADRYPNECSGGEQQRVALARALAADVGLILFDEPLSNLDADRRELLRIEIATLTRESGSSAVYITHDQSEAFALADQVGVLREGSLVQFGSPETIYQQPADAFVTRFTGVSGEFPIVSWQAVDDRLARVTLPFATSVTVDATRPTGSIDGPVSLLVRAAGVSLVDGEVENAVSGVILDAAFTGRGYEHVIALDEKMVLTKVFSHTRRDRGSRVHVVLAPHSCFVMPV